MRLSIVTLLSLSCVVLAAGCKKHTHAPAAPVLDRVDSVTGSYTGTMTIINWSAIVGFPAGSSDSSYPLTISFSRVSADSFNSGALATTASRNLKYDSTGLYYNYGLQGDDYDSLMVFPASDSIHYVYHSSNPVNGGSGGSYGIIKIFSGKK